MSARRAFATAASMAILPTCIFIGGISWHSEYMCTQLIDQLEVSLEKKIDIQTKCNNTLKSSQVKVFYLILLASILINWPVIRWLDDRQWYREWIRTEDRV